MKEYVFKVIPIIISVLSSVFTFLLWRYRAKFKNDLQVNIEKYKGDVNTNVESHKGVILREIENIKITNEKENLSISRYVNVITQERIAWLEKLRNDISSLTAITYGLLEERPVMNSYPALKVVNVIAEAFVDGKLSSSKQEDKSFDNWSKDVESKQTKKEELYRLITLIKLRLNKNEDGLLIGSLDNLEKMVSTFDNIEEKKLKDLVIKIICESQTILKDEWEKVKDEVREGQEQKVISDNKMN